MRKNYSTTWKKKHENKSLHSLHWKTLVMNPNLQTTKKKKARNMWIETREKQTRVQYKEDTNQRNFTAWREHKAIQLVLTDLPNRTTQANMFLNKDASSIMMNAEITSRLKHPHFNGDVGIGRNSRIPPIHLSASWTWNQQCNWLYWDHVYQEKLYRLFVAFSLQMICGFLPINEKYHSNISITMSGRDSNSSFISTNDLLKSSSLWSSRDV